MTDTAAPTILSPKGVGAITRVMRGRFDLGIELFRDDARSRTNYRISDPDGNSVSGYLTDVERVQLGSVGAIAKELARRFAAEIHADLAAQNSIGLLAERPSETSARSFAFDRPGQTADAVVHLALGAASVCWDERPAGVFNSDLAADIGTALLHELGLPRDSDIDALSNADQAALARFTAPNFSVRDARAEEVERLRRLFWFAAYRTIVSSRPTKSRAVALTELETAMMWAVKAFFGAPGE